VIDEKRTRPGLFPRDPGVFTNWRSPARRRFNAGEIASLGFLHVVSWSTRSIQQCTVRRTLHARRFQLGLLKSLNRRFHGLHMPSLAQLISKNFAFHGREARSTSPCGHRRSG
jgi:hypothetical protein